MNQQQPQSLLPYDENYVLMQADQQQLIVITDFTSPDEAV